jgi:hypothetical protein
MSRADKLKALEQAFKGNLKPLKHNGLDPITAFYLVHNGTRELISSWPPIKKDDI